MNKKAQVKFGETIGVIIIVYIIVMTGLMWYNNINSKDINKLKYNNQQELAFEKYYYIANLDLIHLSQKGIIDKEYDINALYTMYNFSISKKGREFLRNQLGESIITLELYRNNELETKTPYEIITLYNNTPKTQINGIEVKEIKERIPFKTLIPVRDNEGKTIIGILNIVAFITE
ncbi:MAG: hypothetical protein KC589_03110 [Nanoarchaeota archaeon]|nr:hypothetical protein [Nanoarchaeota archaeon]